LTSENLQRYSHSAIVVVVPSLQSSSAALDNHSLPPRRRRTNEYAEIVLFFVHQRCSSGSRASTTRHSQLGDQPLTLHPDSSISGTHLPPPTSFLAARTAAHDRPPSQPSRITVIVVVVVFAGEWRATQRGRQGHVCEVASVRTRLVVQDSCGESSGKHHTCPTTRFLFCVAPALQPHAEHMTWCVQMPGLDVT
jgi:hypothetical protein